MAKTPICLGKPSHLRTSMTVFRQILSVLVVLALACSCSKNGGNDPQPVPEQTHTIKVGSWNLWASVSRKKYIDADKNVSRQRAWILSGGAVLVAVKDLDCDIFAFQEICDSIYGKKSAATSLKTMLAQSDPDYAWVVVSNMNGKNADNGGTLNYSPGICYRKSKLTLNDSGVYWLGGVPDAPQWSDDFKQHEYGDVHRACVWARFTHKGSGKQFYFLSTHLDTRSFSAVNYPYVNTENCKNLMSYADNKLIPRSVPSIIAGDMNANPSSAGYKEYLNNNGSRIHHWINAYESAQMMSALGPCAASNSVTHNNALEKMGSERIDHIFYDGFKLKKYESSMTKYPTKDGTLHYPSDHFAIFAVLEFK